MECVTGSEIAGMFVKAAEMYGQPGSEWRVGVPQGIMTNLWATTGVSAGQGKPGFAL